MIIIKAAFFSCVYASQSRRSDYDNNLKEKKEKQRKKMRINSMVSIGTAKPIKLWTKSLQIDFFFFVFGFCFAAVFYSFIQCISRLAINDVQARKHLLIKSNVKQIVDALI